MFHGTTVNTDGFTNIKFKNRASGVNMGILSMYGICSSVLPDRNGKYKTAWL